MVDIPHLKAARKTLASIPAEDAGAEANGAA